MKVLFTGGSSFTGFWFIRALAEAGHQVVATFRQQPQTYTDALRRLRVSLALEACKGVFGCGFGDPAFLALVRSEPWDLLCHHAAEVTDYRSPEFDVAAALAGNTHNVCAVVDAVRSTGRGSARILLTGSVFENDEGAGSQGLPAFSPYGLSKAFTYQVFRYHAARAGVVLGKFVIPNPFGPYEEPRFTSYLLRTWLAGKAASVNTPAYVRDNIHVSLLAKAYAAAAADLGGQSGVARFRPSGYVESQGAFALRFAREMRSRLDVPCDVELKPQSAFDEPRVRINTDPVDGQVLGWNEAQAWDEIAAFAQRAAVRRDA
jgi:UDP-glucose 4-epimerase